MDKAKLVRAGALGTVPMLIGMLPFGLIFGAQAVDAGLSMAATMGLSLIVFAGSSQFVAVGLVTQGAALPLIWLTTLIVNIRHMLYGTVLGPKTERYSWRWLLPLAFTLTDETFATVAQRLKTLDAASLRYYWLGSAMAMYWNWQLWTLVGAWLGQREGVAELGLEFAMAATFIAIVSAQLVRPGFWVCAIVAAIASVSWQGLPYQSGLLAAVAVAIIAGVSVDRVHRRYVNRACRETAQ